MLVATDLVTFAAAVSGSGVTGWVKAQSTSLVLRHGHGFVVRQHQKQLAETASKLVPGDAIGNL